MLHKSSFHCYKRNKEKQKESKKIIFISNGESFECNRNRCSGARFNCPHRDNIINQLINSRSLEEVY